MKKGVREREAWSTLAFLDTYLRKDAAAEAWLAGLTDRIGECAGLFKHK